MRIVGLIALVLALTTACSGRAGEPPSVLLVTLDTTRADRLGCYGYPNAGTPNLDALADRGVLFERAYTVAPITLPAHASIFTGTYPLWHGVHDNGSFQLDDRLDTMAETLAAGGWRTAAFVAAYPVARGFGLEQGFEVYDDAFGHKREDRRFSRAELPAEAVVEKAIDWLDGLAADERFFSWVHVFDAHAIYEPPAPFDTTYADNLYQGEIAYTDQALGRLFDWLERSGRRDKTLVIVVADHGEGLGDHGEETHGALIYDSTMRVPLIIAGPAVPAGVRDPRVVRIIDILPTVTDVTGATASPDVQGRSLLHALRGRDEGPRTAYLETYWPRLQHGWSDLQGVVAGDWKLIVAPGVRDLPPELFDVVQDPTEQADRRAAQTDRWRELAATLEREVETRSADIAFDAERALSDEDREKLAALGYIGDGPGAAGKFDRHPREMVRVLYGYVLVANHLRDGRLPSALKVLDEIERVDPDSLGLHEHRGMVYQDMARRGDASAYGKAIDAFRRALAINDRREDIWMNLGEVHRARGDFVEAVTCYERSMAIAKPSADIEVNFAGLLAAVGQLDDALARLDAFTAREPDFARGHLTRGMLLAANEQWDAALGAFARTVEVAGENDPERLSAHKNAGRLSQQLGRTSDARRHFEAASALNPADPEIRAALAQLP